MCCCISACFAKCFEDLLSKPVIYASISLIAALLHAIFVILILAPYSHCEDSAEFRHDALKLYQVYNCSEIDDLVVDNCILLSSQFDLKHLLTAWIIVDILLAIACVILIVSLCCVKIQCCVAAIMVLPYIAITIFAIAFDIILMLLVIGIYKNHESYSYFLQMIGVHDMQSHNLFRETWRPDGVSTVTRSKLANLFYRLLYHLLNIFFVLLATKHCIKTLCKNRGKKSDADGVVA